VRHRDDRDRCLRPEPEREERREEAPDAEAGYRSDRAGENGQREQHAFEHRASS
jgi:hypothetical protein